MSDPPPTWEDAAREYRAQLAARTIRLACYECDCDAFDGIPSLDVPLALGWEDIWELQTYEQSLAVYDDPDDAPPGYSVLDWMTHYGTCPKCVRLRERRDEQRTPDLFAEIEQPKPKGAS